MRVRLIQCIPVLMLGMGLQAQAAPTMQVLNGNITIAEVIAAQKGWCQGLLNISAAYAIGGFAKAKTVAETVIDQGYGYQYGPVAFNPTLTYGPQNFRPTRAGALAYFVGGDPAFPNDKGFAIKPWRSCEATNHVMQLSGSYATTMGYVSFRNADGQTTTVEKTWAFMKEPDGSIRIVLHHSALPFQG